MFLKKINPSIEDALTQFGITTANELQKNSFSKIKSGVDCLIIAPLKSGKTTQIVISVLQKLGKAYDESPRALIMINNRERLDEITELFQQLTFNSDLRIFGAREKGNVDNEKNHISCGIDVLIGTPKKLNELLIGAGYNVNELDLFIVDDLDQNIADKHEPEISRISNLLPKKTQKVFFSKINSEKLQQLADKLLINPTQVLIEAETI